MGSIARFLDVITLEKTGEFFRLVYDVKGRFVIHRISAEEAKVSYLVCASRGSRFPTMELKSKIINWGFILN